jgi:hypothetical protein
LLFFILSQIEELNLPKFSIASDYRLEEDVLPEMGIKEVFTEQADLSGITEAKKLSVSQVIQEAQDVLPWVLNGGGEEHVGCGDGTCVRTTLLRFLNKCPSSTPVHKLT